MSDRPTPETDNAAWPSNLLQYETVDANFARRLERERDEARDSAEQARAYKRVMKEDNAKLRRERDELDMRLIEVSQFGVVAAIEREDLRKEVAKLHEIIRSEWPEDQAEELIKQCKTQLN